jgi:hypothetical protein
MSSAARPRSAWRGDRHVRRIGGPSEGASVGLRCGDDPAIPASKTRRDVFIAFILSGRGRSSSAGECVVAITAGTLRPILIELRHLPVEKIAGELIKQKGRHAAWWSLACKNGGKVA